jgi:hypothetical protein
MSATHDDGGLAAHQCVSRRREAAQVIAWAFGFVRKFLLKCCAFKNEFLNHHHVAVVSVSDGGDDRRGVHGHLFRAKYRP